MLKNRKLYRKKVLRVVFYLFAWLGIAIGYYSVFTIFFDSPNESKLREANNLLKEQYATLSDEYEQLNVVLQSIEERDKNIYSILFESDPYLSPETLSFNDDQLFEKSNNELAALFFDKLEKLESHTNRTTTNFDSIQTVMQQMGSKLDNIPAIQPIANKELTKFAASYGQRIHPFYKTLVSHQGIDYAIPEDSRIFATADGVVREVTTGYNNKGLTILIDHQNGYTTAYSHLNKVTALRGQRVKRGDIIAHSGNSGMSFMPHLHYEIIYKGMRIDPLNYFFMELNHTEMNKLNNIAKIGMQSLD